MLSISEVILKHLIQTPEYTVQVLPYIKPEYFQRREEEILFSEISNYIGKYNVNPTLESLYVALLENKSFNEKEAENIDEILDRIKNSSDPANLPWLIDKTEEFCKQQAALNAVIECVKIVDGKHKTLTFGAMPDIIKEAASISFNSSLGHDYLDDAEKRHEYYHKVENRVPFDIDYLNKTTKNGFYKKTLSLFMAGPHVGKTALMCHLAANNLKTGRNVVYFTMEMSEEEIAKRIDANILDMTIDDLLELPKELYLKKINNIKSKTVGKIKIEEFPMGGAHAGHFRAFLNDLKIKQNFIPDVIYIDYLNICASQRLVGNKVANSYTIMKSVSEELRSLAAEFNVVMISATQVNRGAAEKKNPGMEDISESFGVNFGVDYMASVVATDDLKELGQVLFVQVKNRFDDMNKIPKFFVGFDRAKMKFYDIEKPEEGVAKFVDEKKRGGGNRSNFKNEEQEAIEKEKLQSHKEDRTARIGEFRF